MPFSPGTIWHLEAFRTIGAESNLPEHVSIRSQNTSVVGEAQLACGLHVEQMPTTQRSVLAQDVRPTPPMLCTIIRSKIPFVVALPTCGVPVDEQIAQESRHFVVADPSKYQSFGAALHRGAVPVLRQKAIVSTETVALE